MGKPKEKDPRAAFFKQLEQEHDHTLPSDNIIGIRLDGRAFHTFARQFEKPFDWVLMQAMDDACHAVIKNVLPHAICGFVQSDEITILVDNRISVTPEGAVIEANNVFSGRLQKLVSLTASAATFGFVRSLDSQGVPFSGVPTFDSRVFLCQTLTDAFENITWRRLDARKNAISMAASALFSPKELLGQSTRDRIKLLSGTEFEKLPESFMNGRFIVPVTEEREVLHKRSGEDLVEPVTVQAKVWKTFPATRELVEVFFKNLGACVSSSAFVSSERLKENERFETENPGVALERERKERKASELLGLV